jgi:ABC-type transport system substrate-binding protein
MIEEARYIMDMKQRTAKYSEIQEKIMSEVPAIPLFSEYQYVAARKNIEGLKVSIDSKIYVNDVVKK